MAFLSRYRKASHGEDFKNQNPARGRKHEALSVLMCAVMQFKNQNPARGRKRQSFWYLHLLFLLI